MRQMQKTFKGDAYYSLSAYNAGPGKAMKVMNGNGEFKKETLEYSGKVLTAAKKYQGYSS